MIDRRRGVARTLVDASKLAAYCRFLRQQAEELAHSHLIKALKRTLFLCSILDLQPWRDRTLQMLNHEAVQWMTRVKRLQDLTKLVQLLPPPRRAPHVIALAAEKDYLLPEKKMLLPWKKEAKNFYYYGSCRRHRWIMVQAPYFFSAS